MAIGREDRFSIVDSFEKIVHKHIQPVVDLVVRLGPTDFRLVSNVPDFPALRYFSAASQSVYVGNETDFELWCVSLSAGTLRLESILPHIDRTCRGQSFASGYYVTDHFGAPVYLVTRGRRCYAFGEELERVVWPYFVKYFLILRTLRDGSLLLKAAACVIGAAGTLLLGRGGTGKTVFLTQLCLHGARFVSNSHAVVKDGRVRGVSSSLRIRPGHWNESLINRVKTNPALKPGELMIDPGEAFAVCADEEAAVSNICVLDFNGAKRHVIQTLSEQEAYDYAEQFSLAINVYRLEEDLLDLYDGDYRRFSQAYSEMKTQLRRLIRHSHCYYISSDILNSKYRDEIYSLLTVE
jgi:hypothetical protein